MLFFCLCNKQKSIKENLSHNKTNAKNTAVTQGSVNHGNNNIFRQSDCEKISNF